MRLSESRILADFSRFSRILGSSNIWTPELVQDCFADTRPQQVGASEQTPIYSKIRKYMVTLQ